MLRRVMGYLLPRPDEEGPEASRQLQNEGYAMLEGVFSAAETTALAEEINAVYEDYRKEEPGWETVLDLDKLAEEEDENWVWGGASTLRPVDGTPAPR